VRHESGPRRDHRRGVVGDVAAYLADVVAGVRVRSTLRDD